MIVFIGHLHSIIEKVKNPPTPLFLKVTIPPSRRCTFIVHYTVFKTLLCVLQSLQVRSGYIRLSKSILGQVRLGQVKAYQIHWAKIFAELSTYMKQCQLDRKVQQWRLGCHFRKQRWGFLCCMHIRKFCEVNLLFIDIQENLPCSQKYPTWYHHSCHSCNTKITWF